MSELEQAPATEQGIIDEKALTRANGILQEYRDGKKPIDQRIEEAERWWLLKQWEVYDKNAKGAQAGGLFQFAHARLLSSLSLASGLNSGGASGSLSIGATILDWHI